MRESGRFRTVAREIYGSPRIARELPRVNRKRIAQLMREGGLVAKAGRKFNATTDSRNTSFGAPDLVQRQFLASAPNRLWCSDLSYLRNTEGWLYLVSVIDVFARQIVGWSTGRKMTAELVKTAIKRALMKRRPQRGLIFHSDQGCQYVSGPVRKVLERHGVRQSMELVEIATIMRLLSPSGIP